LGGGGWGRPRKSWEENSPKPRIPSGTPPLCAIRFYCGGD